ncbi:glycosyltransferase family 2 protein [Paenibacillus sp. E194]|uniref:glycosyltransferase family 2 protein n=1 Tax=Paenibacillus sp. E194 TaxID=1458845 RepID=UPI0005C9F5EF|nr:glycosyltransferase family 2 protein [Paenibacillus sp. E194]
MRVREQRNKVQILLSTYNGEKYLREQLDSLLRQTHSHFFITIRDDGSSDRTTAIIQEYVGKYPNRVEAFYEQNVGVISSFFKLLSNYVHEDTDYVCFCDQDDVWLDNKIERGVRSLGEYATDRSMMYVTPTLMVNEVLQPLHNWPPAPQRGPSFYNALVENIAVGAVLMMNRAAVEKIKSNIPSQLNIVMHDWWVYLVVSSFGKVVYEEKPSIYYRQHQNNVVGGQYSFIDKWVKKWSSYKKHRAQKILWNQAKEFERCWGEHLSLEMARELHQFLLPGRGIIARTKYALTTRLYRQSKLDNLVMRLMLIRGDILR